MGDGGRGPAAGGRRRAGVGRRGRRELRRLRNPCSQRNRAAVRLRQRAAPGHAERPELRPGRARHPAAAGQPLLELLRRALRPVRLPLAADARTRSTRSARTPASRWSPASTRPARGRPSAAAPTRWSRSSTTGIDWSERGLRDQIHLNTGELPYPEHADGSSCGDLRLQRRRRRQRRGLRAGPAREPLLRRAAAGRPG